MTNPPITDLPGLGPKSAGMLAAIGVHSRADLAARGAVGAYLALRQAGQPASLNLLWALEGALTNRDWREVARDDRLRLLLELEARGGRG
ncbi:MAG TPA: TfoX/Sxy family protein [Noviherbaspirillum sp.]|uniref:TfoX/Sxy family protein n=1 Tax=Noviherbaspirillum sp. TaxID=1926288 RepID=UPI002D57AD63|nr:TfoX/Sxy family protein [Noviherbaspirillum sp.]HYD94360.1 TfoX/Sxy family protein [Noviherbaspirillum sp.]